MLGRIAAIARKELRQRIHDRSAIVLVVIAPLLIAAIMSFAFSSSSRFHFSLGIVNADRGSLSSALLSDLEGPSLRHVVSLRFVASAGAAAREVRNGTLGAALAIPPGFSSAAETSSPEPIKVLTSVNSALAASTTKAIVDSFTTQINADRLSVAAAVAAGAGGSQVARLTRAVRAWRVPVGVVDTPVGGHMLTTISYFAPAMAIFFLLFQINFMARSFFFDDKASGMVDRMLVATVRPSEIVLGKAVAATLFSLASLSIIAITTSTLFGAHWGAVVPVALLALVTSAAVGGLCSLVIVLSRTARQAEGLGTLVVFGLAVLGGNFELLSMMSPFMRRLTLITPNGWALRGFTDLATVGGGVPRVAEPIVAILGFAVASGALACALSGRVART